MRSILGVAPMSNFVKEVEYQIAMLAFNWLSDLEADCIKTEQRFRLDRAQPAQLATA